MKPFAATDRSLRAARLRIAVIAVSLAIVGLMIFTAVIQTSVIYTRPFNWWMAPDINAGVS